MTSSDAEPLLQVRSKLFSRQVYVFARWSDGRKQKIARFPGRKDAELWIDDFGADWIEERRKRD